MKSKLSILFIAFFAVAFSINAQTKTSGDTLQQKANHNSVRSNKAAIAGDLAGSQTVLKEGTNVVKVAAGTATSAVSKPVFSNGILYSFTGSETEYAKSGTACDCAGVSVRFASNDADCAANCKLLIPAKKK